MSDTGSIAVDVEISAMSNVRKILLELDADAQRRVIAWLADVFSVGLPRKQHDESTASSYSPALNLNSGLTPTATFAETLEKTEPANNADRALVAAYWLQETEGRESVDGRSINKLLKEHGIDVSNVTNALSSLIDRRPRFAIQAGKKGKFEKLYRLTTEGKKAVLAMKTSEE